MEPGNGITFVMCVQQKQRKKNEDGAAQARLTGKVRDVKSG